MVGRPKRRQRQREQRRAELFDRLRTLRGAAVALDLAGATWDGDRAKPAAAIVAREIAEQEAYHTLAGAVSMLLAACDLIAEATADQDDGLTADDVLAHLRAHTAAHMIETTNALRALDKGDSK